ncbi:hypothetical protein SERLA73DRAFT_184565 [Serpula lacrymans var. lacrymans S7.3]|uniref:Uncharacterized protein n=1 Tax=Serpula lacrymans var. lacrymans (strain S7.3) TaxID=936435 RepID=F8Q4M3_SERL3|nr:hypothetical protein SERLA73DRAFT_184565 [Serpula lacrymans var. lacrymans S7.3]
MPQTDNEIIRRTLVGVPEHLFSRFTVYGSGEDVEFFYDWDSDDEPWPINTADKKETDGAAPKDEGISVKTEESTDLQNIVTQPQSCGVKRRLSEVSIDNKQATSVIQPQSEVVDSGKSGEHISNNRQRHRTTAARKSGQGRQRKTLR